MARPNATHAPDPDVARTGADPRHSPDAGAEAWVDIPRAPANLAEQKLADPECSIGTASDHAGITDDAHEAVVRGDGY
jgi:hypothetical protein